MPGIFTENHRRLLVASQQESPLLQTHTKNSKMAKRTGPSNVQMRGLIQLLKKQGSEQNVSLWRRVALDLEKPARKRRIINVYRINKHTKDNEIIIVPGKVLGTGEINHKVNVAAFEFSDGAVRKITKANGTCMSITDLVQKNPKAQNIRIMG